MPGSPPKIDERTAAVVSQQLQELIRIYAPSWNDVDPQTGELSGLSAGLIRAAGRFSEIVIQRLNQVPQKNFLAFLNLLGASLLPPQPAQVPLTFYLAKGSAADGLVPAGTQVAAPPAPGEKGPVIYETQTELAVTAAQLIALFTRDPERDTYADYSAVISSLSATGDPVFHGNRKTEHVLYVGDSILDSPGIDTLSVAIVLRTALPDPQVVQWECWDGNQWHPVAPASDTSNGLQQSGTISFGSFSSVPVTTVQSVSNHWLRCRLITPITEDTTQRNGMVRSSQLPQVLSVLLSAHIASSGNIPQAAFTNQVPADLTKDFYPFGEKPRLGDSLLLALDPTFARAGTTVTLEINLTNPVDGTRGSAIPKVKPGDTDVELQWEVWNGSSWQLLGVSTPGQSQSSPTAQFVDATKALTVSKTVQFNLPVSLAPMNVGGVSGVWMRVRITWGDYGVDGRWVPAAQGSAVPYLFELATLAPPVIHSLNLSYDVSVSKHAPESLLADNDFVSQDLTQANQSSGFAPFVAMQDVRPTFYFGFSLPADRTTFSNNPISLFLRSADLKYGESTVPLSPDVSRAAADPGAVASHAILLTNPATVPTAFMYDVVGPRWQTVTDPPAQTTITLNPGESKQIQVKVTVATGTAFGDSDSGFLRLLGDTSQPRESSEFISYAHEEAAQTQQLRIVWEYWDGRQWSAVAVKDNTDNFSHDGVVEFLPPPDFAAHAEFGLSPYYWLRTRWEAGEFEREPRLSRVLPNTVIASQTITVQDEILGSSDGSANQMFATARSPVLSGQSLQVREAEMPTGDALQAIQQEEGDDAVSIVLDSVGQPQEIWVRWHEVQDFYASDSRSRHYTLNRLTGEVSFGDGLSGLVPPVGVGNVKLALYRTGGGVRGNRAAETIVQLKTTLPYIDKATNLEPASGGAEGESTDSLIARAPTEIRHRHRAVTVEDYEDLARLASPDVARALCVANRDLVADPFDTMPEAPGNVSVIIVPDSTDPKPQPSFELVQRVQQFFTASSPANVNTLVVGPLYIRVDVQVEIGLASLEGSGTVVQKVQNQLAAFLHPLTGGFDGTGWEFGRAPHRSDLYALIRQIPEADHVRSLVVSEVEDSSGTRGTGRFLVYSGNHTIQLVFEPS